MKLNKDFKTVGYCGYSIIVPEWANYAAVDEDGSFCIYEYEPLQSVTIFDNEDGIYDELEYLNQVFEFEDWQESLVKF